MTYLEYETTNVQDSMDYTETITTEQTYDRCKTQDPDQNCQSKRLQQNKESKVHQLEKIPNLNSFITQKAKLEVMTKDLIQKKLQIFKLNQQNEQLTKMSQEIDTIIQKEQQYLQQLQNENMIKQAPLDTLNQLNKEMFDFNKEILEANKNLSAQNTIIFNHFWYFFSSIYPQFNLQIMGSQFTQLQLPCSNLDLCLNTYQKGDTSNDILETIIYLINQIHPWVHKVENFKFQISVQLTSQFNDRVIYIYVNQQIEKIQQSETQIYHLTHKFHPQLKLVFLVLKQLLYLAQLHQPYNGGINSYCLFLILMAIFHWQFVEQKTQFNDDQKTPVIILIQFFRFFEASFKTGHKIIMYPILRGLYVPFDHKSIVIEKSKNQNNHYLELILLDPLKQYNPKANLIKRCFMLNKIVVTILIQNLFKFSHVIYQGFVHNGQEKNNSILYKIFLCSKYMRIIDANLRPLFCITTKQPKKTKKIKQKQKMFQDSTENSK